MAEGGRLYRPIYTYDGERRESSVWWMDFSVDGERIRKSTGERDKKLAEKALAAEMALHGKTCSFTDHITPLRKGRSFEIHPNSVEITKRSLRSAKRRARKRDVPFDLKLKQVPPVPRYCPVLRIPLRPCRGKSGPGATSPSLDRIVPLKGYVAGNVQWLSHRANSMKRDCSPTELVSFAKWVAKQYRERWQSRDTIRVSIEGVTTRE